MKVKRIVIDTLEKNNIHLTKGKSDFFTYSLRPKYADNIAMAPYGQNKDVAIVIQGPVKYEDDFTLESIKLYKKMFPDSEVILATWDNESPEMLQKAKEYGAIISLSDYEGLGELKNSPVNLQMTNTLAGMKIAADLGVKYIAKTRTDQRIYCPKAWKLCKKMLDMFPLEAKTPDGAAYMPQGRVIASSLGTFSNRLYNVSDLFLFGYAKDMVQYFSCPYDERDYREIEQIKHECDETGDAFTYSKTRSGEIYFSTAYLEACGIELAWTMEHSLEMIRDRFIIIDQETIDLYWAKYGDKEYKWRKYRDNERPLTQMTFSDWLIKQ